MNFDTVFGSAVIAAIFSGLLSYIISRKQGSLQYITAERKEWREEIRIIASNLYGASYKETLQLLTELKVRINAFGNKGVSVRYSKDAHIWELINDIEEKKPKNNILVLKQKQLIEFLSLLLKDDWERAKKEVKGDVYGIIGLFLFVISDIYIIVSIFLLHIDDISVFNLISTGCVYLIVTVILNGVFIFVIKCNDILEGVITEKPKKYKKGRLYVCYIICAISVIAFGVLYIKALKDFLDIISCGENDLMIVLVSSIIHLFGLFLSSWVQISDIDKKYYYNDSINKVKSCYKELENEMLNNKI